MSSPFQSQILGNPFIQLAAVDSTNNYAMAQIHNGLAVAGTTWFAQQQTAGKGQRGKQWNAAPGLNILQSTAIDAGAFALRHPFALTVIVANAVRSFFSRYAGDETRIKWPNDLYWRDRKAGGMLIENVIRGNQWSWAVVGIGININQTSFEGLPNPVSLRQITGKTFDAASLGRELCADLHQHYQQYLHEGFAPAMENYLQWLYKKGAQVQLRKDGQLFTGMVKGVDDNGDLLMQDAPYERLVFGEVEWVINE